ncbi:MAG: hypothetical protein O2825_16770, partial [Proteobacteria bacterium]|nr:hypothetical protein [Pseudomonadota bacterium]
CRDFALMLTAMLRHKGVPARVRCGFAGYFGDGWEDHWVCECRAGDRWALADPQLDGAHRRHLAVAFDPADMPRDRFLCAWEAWHAIRQQGAAAEGFGHGDATGLWFVAVNLARDLHALAKRETSAWDGWRDAAAQDRVLDAAGLRTAQAMADLARNGVSGADVHEGGAGCWHPRHRAPAAPPPDAVRSPRGSGRLDPQGRVLRV